MDAAPMGQTRVLADGGGALEDRARHGGVVVHGPRIGHGADSREAAARRGARPGFDGFRTLAAGLAQVAVQIDEPGRDDQARGVERFAVRRAARRRPNSFRRRDARDAVAVDPNVADWRRCRWQDRSRVRS